MSERNGPGGMNTERRSPMMTSGVATPSVASNNIAVVMKTAATNPASKPTQIAFVVLTRCDYQLWRRLCQAPLVSSAFDTNAATTISLCRRANFPCALHDHGGRDLLHAGMIKRALAQASVIAWLTW